MRTWYYHLVGKRTGLLFRIIAMKLDACHYG